MCLKNCLCLITHRFDCNLPLGFIRTFCVLCLTFVGAHVGHGSARSILVNQSRTRNSTKTCTAYFETKSFAQVPSNSSITLSPSTRTSSLKYHVKVVLSSTGSSPHSTLHFSSMCSPSCRICCGGSGLDGLKIT